MDRKSIHYQFASPDPHVRKKMLQEKKLLTAQFAAGQGHCHPCRSPGD